MLSNKWYDILKYVAQIGLPGLGTFVFAISKIWGIPHAEQIVGTIVAVDAFLGILLGVSTSQYQAKQEASKELSEPKEQA